MPEEVDRVVVPIADAIARLSDDDYIHTFMQAGPALIGADHARDDLIAAMREHGVEESGEQASAMGHTLVIVNFPLWTGGTTPLFIEAKRNESHKLATR